MSWLQSLADELTARGIRGSERRRILDELGDHIACEPESVDRLGDPKTLAVRFADELATARTRGWALRSFAALSAVAAVLAYSQLALARIGYPGFDHGHSQLLFWPALLGIVIAPQAALVAGTLAALRALRRRRAPLLPAAELALIARRTRIALVAGALTVLGTELFVINFSSRLPTWWLISVGACAALAGGGLVAAWRGVADARSIAAAAPGPAGDIFDDLPVLDWPWLRARAWVMGAAAVVAVGALMTALVGHAEHSVLEGLQRGVVEAVAAAIGFAALGRALGLLSGRRKAGAPGGAEPGPGGRAP